MNKKQKAAIAHYKRMQKWVRTRHKEGYPHGYLMFVAIDETWGVEDCTLSMPAVSHISCKHVVIDSLSRVDKLVFQNHRTKPGLLLVS